MTGPLPDRASVFRDSPYFREDCARIGVRFNGRDRRNEKGEGDVMEYCVSEGWIRTKVKGRDRAGNQLTLKLNGTVEPYWR